uniref:Uncharacterized protein n=1 Tax=Arundo donax TaxID=35708 RepID=A0A0A9E796_ARUDO
MRRGGSGHLLPRAQVDAVPAPAQDRDRLVLQHLPQDVRERVAGAAAAALGRGRRRRGRGFRGGVALAAAPVLAAAADGHVAERAALGPVPAARLAEVPRLRAAVVVVVAELGVGGVAPRALPRRRARQRRVARPRPSRVSAPLPHRRRRHRRGARRVHDATRRHTANAIDTVTLSHEEGRRRPNRDQVREGRRSGRGSRGQKGGRHGWPGGAATARAACWRRRGRRRTGCACCGVSATVTLCACRYVGPVSRSPPTTPPSPSSPTHCLYTSNKTNIQRRLQLHDFTEHNKALSSSV